MFVEAGGRMGQTCKHNQEHMGTQRNPATAPSGVLEENCPAVHEEQTWQIKHFDLQSLSDEDKKKEGKQFYRTHLLQECRNQSELVHHLTGLYNSAVYSECISDKIFCYLILIVYLIHNCLVILNIIWLCVTQTSWSLVYLHKRHL